MKRKSRMFCGHEMTKRDHGAVVTLIGMTTASFQLHKNFFRAKEPALFWTAIERITGMQPAPGEAFMASVMRINMAIIRKGKPARAAMIATVDRKSFFQELGVPLISGPKITLPRKSASVVPTTVAKEAFYKSWEWRQLRMEVIKERGRRCECCGATPTDKSVSGNAVRIVVDHIKPLSKHWGLRLTRTNLQILCDECNQGKGAWDETDWREPEVSLDDTAQTDPLTAQFRAVLQ